MNTAFEQISFIRPEPKTDDRRNALRLRERLLSEHGFDNFDDTDISFCLLPRRSPQNR